MIYTDLIFVFLFLPVYAVLMLALRERYEKNLAAVVMSLIFFVWGRPLYYALIFLNIFTTYAAGRLSTKHNYNVIRITVTSLAAASSVAAAVALASDNTVKGAVSAFGVLLFALRCGLYLRDAEDGGEKNIINLCVYLMSFEFMAVSPVLAYSEIKEGIAERKTNLAMLSGGLERFVGGLAAYSILGYSLERVRQAALFGDSLPYINAIVGVIATAVVFYVVICAYLAMSEGLCLIGGYRIKMWDSSFTPRSLVKNHLGYAYLSLAAVLNSGKEALCSVRVAGNFVHSGRFQPWLRSGRDGFRGNNSRGNAYAVAVRVEKVGRKRDIYCTCFCLGICSACKRLADGFEQMVRRI